MGLPFRAVSSGSRQYQPATAVPATSRAREMRRTFTNRTLTGTHLMLLRVAGRTHAGCINVKLTAGDVREITQRTARPAHPQPAGARRGRLRGLPLLLHSQSPGGRTAGETRRG